MKKLWRKWQLFIANFKGSTEEIVPDPEANGRWRLFYGIHKGTTWSRETVSNYYNSEQEARDAYKQAKRFHTSYRYTIWFAYLYDPDGRKQYIDRINRVECKHKFD